MRAVWIALAVACIMIFALVANVAAIRLVDGTDDVCIYTGQNAKEVCQ